MRLVEAHAVELLLSNAVLEEWREVLSRPDVLRHFPGVSAQRIQQLLAAVSQSARFFEPSPAPISVDRDPKDQKYIDLAFAGQATFLVTRDYDLLDLVNDARWNQTGASFQIVDPVTFLQAMARRSSTA